MATAWELTGNGASPAGSFLGTTDAQPLVVKTSNAERLRIDSNGHVGVGTAAPHATLDVAAIAQNDTALAASSNSGIGAHAQSQSNTGLFTTSNSGIGVDARSNSGIGAQAVSQTNTGLFATSDSGFGIDSRSNSSIAIRAQSQSNTGLFATSDSGIGVDGRSNSGIGAQAHSESNTGLYATSVSGMAIFASGGQFAGFFQGDVTVTGDVLLPGADCAEHFDIAAGERPPDAGTVVVIDEGGGLKESGEAYDRKVAGVVSGGGDYRTAIVLDKRASDNNRVAIALVGKVYCKVDASYGAIEVGDLLTSSMTQGHAMKASDASKAFGAILGKALRPLASGRGLIPVLVALQ